MYLTTDLITMAWCDVASYRGVAAERLARRTLDLQVCFRVLLSCCFVVCSRLQDSGGSRSRKVAWKPLFHYSLACFFLLFWHRLGVSSDKKTLLYFVSLPRCINGYHWHTTGGRVILHWTDIPSKKVGVTIVIILSASCYGNRVKLEPCYQNFKCTGRGTGLLAICYPVGFVMFSSLMPSDCSYSHHSQVSMLSCCKNRESSPSHFVS